MVTLLWYQEKTLVITTALLVSLQSREVLALMEDGTLLALVALLAIELINTETFVPHLA
jgi:hypothetical protein